jgi:hypothetical protein
MKSSTFDPMPINNGNLRQGQRTVVEHDVIDESVSNPA